jgi:hypothetical protein
MFQTNVGEKELPKIQLIVLDMKRVKMKFSHNYVRPENETLTISRPKALSSSKMQKIDSKVFSTSDERSAGLKDGVLSKITETLHKDDLSEVSKRRKTTVREPVGREKSSDDIEGGFTFSAERSRRSLEGATSSDISNSGVVARENINASKFVSDKNDRENVKVSVEISDVQSVLTSAWDVLNTVGQGGNSAW